MTARHCPHCGGSLTPPAPASGRVCEYCGDPMSPKGHEGPATFARRRFCSRSCASLGRDSAASIRNLPRPRRTDDDARMEDLEWLLDSGESVQAIPARLGLGEASLRAWLFRIDRRDVWNRLRELGQRQKLGDDEPVGQGRTAARRGRAA